MDDIVKAAIEKWPNVPHCYGWLGLDARGIGTCATRLRKRQRLPEQGAAVWCMTSCAEFISRNYEARRSGRGSFQNSPQLRVYLLLEAALGAGRAAARCRRFDLRTHTGLAIDQVDSAWLDDMGRLFLATEHGLGLKSAIDGHGCRCRCAGIWRLGEPQEITFQALRERFGYQLNPQP